MLAHHIVQQAPQLLHKLELRVELIQHQLVLSSMRQQELSILLQVHLALIQLLILSRLVHAVIQRQPASRLQRFQQQQFHIQEAHIVLQEQRRLHKLERQAELIPHLLE